MSQLEEMMGLDKIDGMLEFPDFFGAPGGNGGASDEQAMLEAAIQASL